MDTHVFGPEIQLDLEAIPDFAIVSDPMHRIVTWNGRHTELALDAPVRGADIVGLFELDARVQFAKYCARVLRGHAPTSIVTLQLATPPGSLHVDVRCHLHKRHLVTLIREASHIGDLMRVQLEARTCALTGVSNRLAYDEEFARLGEQLHRGVLRCLSHLVVDIDFFKRLNDVLGHEAGDQALVTTAQTLEAALPRRVDRLYRCGGEEFSVLLPGTDASGAAIVAERLRASVEAAGGPTVSVGVATALPPDRRRGVGSGVTAFMTAFRSRSDKALYDAKHGGRNRISSSQEAMDSDWMTGEEDE